MTVWCQLNCGKRIRSPRNEPRWTCDVCIFGADTTKMQKRDRMINALHARQANHPHPGRG